MQRTDSRIYPLLICGLVALFLGFTGWSIYRAVRAEPNVLDPEYYSRGLRYNQTLLERRAAASLGWKMVATLEGRRLVIELAGSDRAAVRGAKGSLRPADSTVFPTLRLREISPGHYTASLPAQLSGDLRVRIEFERQGARLVRDLLLALADD
ncbi:MAG: hypothetical protein D6751_01860 [Deltaproteobacteria bacterium]|nr:MAG: hypothetical protein D6751_01860 [Deltaproteobacteria bacterium]